MLNMAYADDDETLFDAEVCFILYCGSVSGACSVFSLNSCVVNWIPNIVFLLVGR